MKNKSIQSPHELLVLQLIFGHEGFSLLLLHYPYQLVIVILQPAYLLQMLKL